MADTPAPPPVDNPPPAVPPEADPDVAIMRARIAEYEAKDSAAAQAATAAAEAERERLKRSGDVDALLAAQNADLTAERAKNAALAAEAADGRAWHARETARIEAAKAVLTDRQRAVIDQAPTIALKAAFLDELLANAQPGGVQFKAPPVIGGGPPSPIGAAVDIGKLVMEQGGLAKAKRDYPDQWQAYRKTQLPSGAATTAGKFFQSFGKKSPSPA